MDRHRLKQLRNKIGELLRFGSPSCIREAHSIMRDEFENVLSFALDLTEPKPTPKHTIADNYPAGGLTATEPCMFCKDYNKLEEQNEKLINSHEKLVKALQCLVADHPAGLLPAKPESLLQAVDVLKEAEKP